MSLIKSLGNVFVGLKAYTNVDPLELASFAAKYCYEAQPPKFGDMIDVEKRLFLTGHHTTLEHFYLTFEINGISVGDVTLGLHLASPFYNSDQRSGRFCSEMFSAPDIDGVRKYVGDFWSGIESHDSILDYFRRSVEVYNANIEKATEIAARFIKEERPFASEKYIQQNAPKIAREQLRVFMPVIFPTGLVYTIDLITLVSMYRTAFNPVMKWVVGRMVEEMLVVFPKLKFMFPEEAGAGASSLKLDYRSSGQALYKPDFELRGTMSNFGMVIPEPRDMHPVDTLHFHPKFMDNSVLNVDSTVEISLATMGQDQRHRLIRRSLPVLTGNFYIPPVVRELKLEGAMESVMANWDSLQKNLPESLWYILAPYGAMVAYSKSGSVNAIAHEQAKRTCWCAQEEIYHLSRLQRKTIEFFNPKSELLEFFQPPCWKTGKCAECTRYCGRNMKASEYFPERKV
ncbi:MAG: FAD-dependent thymidylate synthase [bacterium]|nr:FAD-dependent thymidylate synthase [bacterium]